MSLLLDALKKAEKEKQRAREAEAGLSGQKEQTEKNRQDVLPEELPEPAPDVEEPLASEESSDELELVLDDVEEVPAEITLPAEEPETEAEVKQGPLTLSPEYEKSAATTTTVSDQALQLLVYKTNKRYRQKHKIVWGSMLSVAAIILLTAGGYYYLGVMDEMDALERKHRLAMREVRAGTERKTLVRPVQDDVSKAATQEQQVVNTVTEEKIATAKKSNKSVSQVRQKADTERQILIMKTDALDHVNAWLRDAWMAYNRADYRAASEAYEKVLKREPKNRDALLGVAAIAVKKADYKKAKESYQLLLKLNPRDEVAMSAMSNIKNFSMNSLDESKLKFMLQQQPEASHLNFALGNIYARQGRWPEAQSEYFRAWQGNKENADYVYNLAVSLDQLGKTKEALGFYKSCLSLAQGQNISYSKDTVENRIQVLSAK
ncbi:MAG: tetratricopeptide repeat protein [Gammaproteobacteria bacterium]|nr:tetratricopeptide repeat protein [Gammaproteobacteria bacterium]